MEQAYLTLRLLFVSLVACLPDLLIAQGVGINNPTPDASALLDLTSTNKGLLVPRMNTAQRDGIPLPATSLLVYNTTNARFEFFNGSAWVPLVVSGGTLDQAYDFGGAGAGRTITADAGAVRVDGTDGLQVTGTQGSGATLALSGEGTRMFFYPRKAAFRAGIAQSDEWDDPNVGLASMSAGTGTRASGDYSFSVGFVNQALGGASASFGASNISSGNTSTTFGANNNAQGRFSTVMGLFNTAPSVAETVLGIGSTAYTPSLNGATQYRTPNATDRLLVVGNAIDVNNNDILDPSERSNAFLILKNGNTAIGNITPTTKLDVDGQVRIRGGNPATGTVLTSDANGTGSWQVPKQPDYYVAVGTGVASIGTSLNPLFQMQVNFVPKHPIAIVHFSASTAGGSLGCSTPLEFQLFVNGTAVMTHFSGTTGDGSTFSNERGYDAAFTYPISVTPGVNTTVQIRARAEDCSVPCAAGRSLVVIDPNGTGLTTTTGTPPSTGSWDLTGNFTTNPTVNFVGTRDNQALAFRTFNTERMRISNTGNVGIGTTNPLERFHLAGRSLFENGFSADNAALLYRNNTHYMFIGPQSGSSANGGAIALYGSANNTGTNPNGIDLNAPGGNIRMNHTGGNFEFRANSTSGYTATMELNDVGFQIGHNSASRNIQIVNGGGERVRIDAAGRIGIGTTAPATLLQVNGAVSTTPMDATATANPFNFAPGDRTYVRMGSNNAPTSRFVTLAAGLTPGQMLIIECSATGTNGIQFMDNALQNVGGSKQLLGEDSITFIWNGTKWILISYADN